MAPLTPFLTLLSLVSLVLANVEKTIFLAPPILHLPQSTSPNIVDLHLSHIHPRATSLRTFLPRVFASSSRPYGTENWVLLRDLKAGARYEVRICWVATTPTAFELDLFQFDQVMSTPDLITSLSDYAEKRLESPEAEEDELQNEEQSMLFLRVRAKADYFSSNKTLMQFPPDVLVDIILDEYLYGVLPDSLKWTVVYILGVAGLAWYISPAVLRLLLDIAHSSDSNGITTRDKKDAVDKKSK
jgi:hypothetical protein